MRPADPVRNQHTSFHHKFGYQFLSVDANSHKHDFLSQELQHVAILSALVLNLSHIESSSVADDIENYWSAMRWIGKAVSFFRSGVKNKIPSCSWHLVDRLVTEISVC